MAMGQSGCECYTTIVRCLCISIDKLTLFSLTIAACRVRHSRLCQDPWRGRRRRSGKPNRGLCHEPTTASLEQ